VIQLNRKVRFVDAVLGGDIEAAVAILQSAEERHQLRFTVIATNLPEYQLDDWYEARLWPFLSETNLILTAGDLFGNDWSLIDPLGVDHTPTWRQWGGLVADWANQHWPARPAGLGQTRRSQAARPWEYLDFYMDVYLETFIEDYTAWRTAVLRVLSAKDRAPASNNLH